MPSPSRLYLAACLLLPSLAATAAQEPPSDRSLAAACFTCHGTDGRSVGDVPPSLAGRDRAELVRQMMDFKAGKRPATIMHQHAKGYTDAQIERIAAYFAAVGSGPAAPAPSANQGDRP